MNETLIGNMTASGPSLRALVVDLTGCDPLAEDIFDWSNETACERCEVIDSTAVVDIDGEGDERLCYHCLSESLA